MSSPPPTVLLPFRAANGGIPASSRESRSAISRSASWATSTGTRCSVFWSSTCSPRRSSSSSGSGSRSVPSSAHYNPRPAAVPHHLPQSLLLDMRPRLGPLPAGLRLQTPQHGIRADRAFYRQVRRGILFGEHLPRVKYEHFVAQGVKFMARADSLAYFFDIPPQDFRFLRPDGVFILQMVASHAGNLTCAKVIQN